MPKISQYTEVTTNTETDVLLVNQSGTTKKTTLAKIKTALGVGDTPPTPEAANDFQVAAGSPLAWAKKTLDEVKSILGLGGTVPAAANTGDFIVAGGSPADWEKKTLAETKGILDLDEAVVMAMLLDKDAAVAAEDNLGNVQIPVPAAVVGKYLSRSTQMIISPLGTASTSGTVTFHIVRHRPGESPVAQNMTESAIGIAEAAKASVVGDFSVSAGVRQFAAGDFFSVTCAGAGTGTKGPLWLKLVASDTAPPVPE